MVWVKRGFDSYVSMGRTISMGKDSLDGTRRFQRLYYSLEIIVQSSEIMKSRRARIPVCSSAF